MSTARKAYETTEIGATTMIRAEGDSIEALEAFKSDVDAVAALAAEGLVEIKQQHRESQSGARYVDVVSFKRLA